MHFYLPPEAPELPFSTRMHLDAPQKLNTLFRSLDEVYRQKEYLHQWQQHLLLQQILCEIFQTLHTKDTPINLVRIRKVLAYIHENLSSPLSMEDLLQQAGVRKSLFLTSFREVTGTTPRQYILAQRLEYAQALLLETDLPIAVLAEKSGFSDPFHFSRCFRKKFQFSPQQYRAKHRTV